MTTEPKLADKIVYKFQNSHIKLLANRLVLTNSKKSVGWREATVNEDQISAFTYALDNTDSRAADKLYITLNRAGLYDIKASASKDSSLTKIGLTIDVSFPGQSPFEVAFAEMTLTNFETIIVGIPFRVLPSQVGTKLYISSKTDSGSGAVIRGYNYGDSKYDDGAQAGSWLDIAYLGP